MRSAIFTGVGQPLSIEERPLPKPGRGQALMRVCRCGICTSDLHMTSGSPMDVKVGTALGHEYAGEVVEVGADGWLRPGDRVTALPLVGCGDCPACKAGMPLHCAQVKSMDGGYSEYTLIEQRVAMKLPDQLSFADGALIEPLACGVRAMAKLTIEPGARIAVLGVGAIGASALFWARRSPAGKVAAVARTRRQEALVAALGGDALVTTGEGFDERLRAALGGPPDIVIEGAGFTGALQQALEMVRPGGTILSMGGCVHADSILPVLGMWKEVRILFSVAYEAKDFHAAIDTLAAGAVAPRAMVGETIGLSALPATFEAMRTQAHAAKVMVDPQAA